jgi:hypothetical protein
MRHDVSMLFRRKASNPQIEDTLAPDGRPLAIQPMLQVSLDPSVDSEVRLLIAQRRKIQAIKVVREHTRLRLKEAKDLVDAMEAGHPIHRVGQPPLAGRLSDQVRALESAGDHPSAIAVVRAQTGMTAEEAERFIAALEL